VRAEERSSLLHDLCVETLDSWRGMSLTSRVVLAAGVIGIVVLNVLERTTIPGALLSALRVAALTAVVAGCVANSRAADEFYQRVYLYACTFTLVVAVPVLYALAEFGVNLGVRSVSVVAGIFGVAFLAVFAAMRRG